MSDTLINKDTWNVRTFIFSAGKEKEGKKHSYKTRSINTNRDYTQKKTLSITLIDEVSKTCEANQDFAMASDANLSVQSIGRGSVGLCQLMRPYAEERRAGRNKKEVGRKGQKRE